MFYINVHVNVPVGKARNKKSPNIPKPVTEATAPIVALKSSEPLMKDLVFLCT